MRQHSNRIQDESKRRCARRRAGGSQSDGLVGRRVKDGTKACCTGLNVRAGVSTAFREHRKKTMKRTAEGGELQPDWGGVAMTFN